MKQITLAESIRQTMNKINETTIDKPLRSKITFKMNDYKNERNVFLNGSKVGMCFRTHAGPNMFEWYFKPDTQKPKKDSYAIWELGSEFKISGWSLKELKDELQTFYSNNTANAIKEDE